jgi:hypothetical protein
MSTFARECTYETTVAPNKDRQTTVGDVNIYIYIYIYIYTRHCCNRWINAAHFRLRLHSYS